MAFLPPSLAFLYHKMKSRLLRWRLGSKQALHPRCVREVQCAQGIMAICFPLTTAGRGQTMGQCAAYILHGRTGDPGPAAWQAGE